MADPERLGSVEEVEEGAPEWVVTFGDMMSLLLCFFVLLLSFSQMDTVKFKQLAGSLEKAFGVQKRLPVYETPKGMKIVARDFDQALVEQLRVGDAGSRELLRSIAEELHDLLEPLQKEGLVEFDATADYIILRFLGQATFDSGQAAIKPEVMPLLRTVGEVIGRTEREVIVAGHTDNVPIRGGIYKSNLELSAARAASVVNFFLAEGLVKPERIATMGFGEYRPLVVNDSPANRLRNRRVEVILATIHMMPPWLSAPSTAPVAPTGIW